MSLTGVVSVARSSAFSSYDRASRRGMELKRRRTNSVGKRRHSRWTSCQSSSSLRGKRRDSRIWTQPQRCSMGLRSRELPGHSKIEMPLSSRNARVEAAECAGALSCMKIQCTRGSASRGTQYE